MNSNFRNFAIWIVILLLLVALFNLFQNSPTATRRANEISYSELLAGVEAGNVSEVEIRGHRISGQFKDARPFFSIAPEDPGLVERLNKKGVKITAR